MTDIKYEPTREHWTPYEPWMRDVLADDARVSFVRDSETGGEIRCPWSEVGCGGPDLRIHPDDVPERPTEAHVALRVAIVDEWRGRPDSHFNLADAAARVAREHIAADVDPDKARVCYSDECGEPCQSKQERDRDEIARLGTQIGLLSYRLGDERKSRKKAEAAMRAEVKDHDATRARADRLKRLRDEWKARYEALRADVERTDGSWGVQHYTYGSGEVRLKPVDVAREIIRELIDKEETK